jgi:hypothetical protein
MKKKNKKKAIHAEYRKTSESFPEWLKYEVTILSEDGKISKVPAYGKDLQDALSRVVHDEKVEKVSKTTKRIPDLVWVLMWFGYMLGLVQLTYSYSGYNEFNGLFFMGGMIILTTAILSIKNWLRLRNIDKE